MTISLVATSHGTAVPAAQASITALVEAVREASPHLDVREAFVDVQTPSVADVVDDIDGLAVVVPLLLAPGFHVHVDIRQAADRPGVVASGTLGPDPRLTDVLRGRLADAGATKDDVIVLGAAGSTDIRARQSVDAAARQLGAAWGSPVPVGYVGGTGTPIDEIVRDVARSGRRVVVASYLMAPGFFHDRLRECGADAVTRPVLDGLDVAPEMVSLVLDRFADAAGVLDWAAASTSHRVREQM
ncbi:sirohydrochlorin chelatase [Aeromicrobium sp. 9AM]|uniref:sirohydrochlorin chelatase n=1 Tax=Aeromicrobium sp. 9AM TaxID=2653126 RepID=UPI0012F01909|nr:CbiX/SirB N-terminal domain-containing protein [Aeromicrobium sp. 9AM]VXB31209.1 conserved hypothetical protein [Aeromicrobium sp. 9AM]